MWLLRAFGKCSSRNYCIDCNRILLNEKDQIFIVDCAPGEGVKSAIYIALFRVVEVKDVKYRTSIEIIGPILWGHSGPLCHALSLLSSSSSSLWTSMRRRRATVATPGERQCGVRRLAVANGPNIFQMLLVLVKLPHSFAVSEIRIISNN